MQQDKAPHAIGFFFSLGHSTMVVLASVAIAVTTTALQGRLAAWRDIGGAVGTMVSALFLLLIGIANLFIQRGVWAAFIRIRNGQAVGDDALDGLLAGRGLLTRLFRPIFRVVSRSWHMYPIGLLFVLGSTPRQRSVLSASRRPRPRRACRSGRSWCFPRCSLPACRCWTPPTAC
jgi:high-affinity nickel-transport protein